MKKLISILGITTVGTNSLIVPIQNINNKEQTFKVENNVKSNEQNTNITEQWYLNIADTKQETIYKDNLLSAISLKNNQINFDLNKIDKNLWNDDNIYSLILNPEYQKNLQFMYQLGSLKFIDGKPQFLEKPDYYSYNGIWAESKWYWFGYWKLHIGHVQCNYIMNIWDNGIGVFVELVGAMFVASGGIIAVAAPAIAAWLGANYFIIQNYDKGNGIWIGFYGPIPNLGWGSD